jgi:hypothetical protein
VEFRNNVYFVQRVLYRNNYQLGLAVTGELRMLVSLEWADWNRSVQLLRMLVSLEWADCNRSV